MEESTFAASATKSSADWQSLQISVRRELTRRNPGSLLDWSLAHRFLRGAPMRLTPALRDIYLDDFPFIAIQKAAQIFVSEYLWEAKITSASKT